jgi:hypothetical protein
MSASKRVSKYDYIHNVSLYRLRPIQLAQCLGLPVRTVYALRNNRLRHGKANEVIRDLLTMTDTAFLMRYRMRKRAMRKRWGLDD